MNQVIKAKRRALVDETFCVACGCCVKACPLGAVSVYRGITAQVNPAKCVGCGKCVQTCPASVIVLREVQV